MKIYITLMLVIIGYGPFAQTRSLPPIIKKLNDIKGQVISFQHNSENLFESKDLPNVKYEGSTQIIKSKSGLYVCIPGTGRVYEIETKNDKLVYKRIDKTIFFGYNFQCLFFSLDTSLYSFGGQGFWIVNGNLRKYNSSTCEWHAIQLSENVTREFYTQNTMHFLDTSNQSLTIVGPDVSPAYLKDRNKDSIYKNKILTLDITSGRWHLVGDTKNGNFYHYGITPWGVFTGETVVDIKNNKIYSYSGIEKFALLNGAQTRGDRFDISFCVDSTIFFGNFEDRIDSLTISRSDLIDTGLQLYTPIKKPSSFTKEHFLIVLVVGLSIISIVLFIKLYSKKNTNATVASIGIPGMSTNEGDSDIEKKEQNKESSVMFKSSKILDLLEQRERVLLKFIYQQSSEDRLTTIDEINKVIGASQRTNEIQKRLRSDIITSINEKLGIVSNNKKPVIDKQRSEFDKRSFEYYIRKEHMELVEKIV
jgi:hypothetical protein